MKRMNKIGKFGEDVACLFLKKHGYRVIERNYLKKWGELDIVAKKAGKLCFVEVKTIKDVTHGTVTQETPKVVGGEFRPEDNMNQGKIKKFTRIIQTYLQEKGIDHKDWSAALVAIRVDMVTKKARVRFIENLVLQ